VQTISTQNGSASCVQNELIFGNLMPNIVELNGTVCGCVPSVFLQSHSHVEALDVRRHRVFLILQVAIVFSELSVQIVVHALRASNAFLQHLPDFSQVNHFLNQSIVDRV